MGKTVLLLMTAVIISGTLLASGQAEIRLATNEGHRIDAAQTFAREATDGGSGIVLAAAMRDGYFSGTPPFELCDTLDFAGGEFLLSYYEATQEDKSLEFIVEGSFPYTVSSTGEVRDTTLMVRNRYRWLDPEFIGPLSLNMGYGRLEIENGSRVDGNTTVNGEATEYAAYFDTQRYDAYDMWRVEDDQRADRGWNATWNKMTVEMRKALTDNTPLDVPGRGMMENDNPAMESSYRSMDHMYEQNPNLVQPLTVWSEAEQMIENGHASVNLVRSLTEFAGLDLGSTVFYNFSETLFTNTSAVLGSGDISAPSIVYSDKAIHVADNFQLSGAGLLMIKDGLVLGNNAELNWDGIIYIKSSNDTLEVDLENGQLNVTGSLVIDHDSPPPGGHMDLTTFQDPSGTWSDPWGFKGTSSGYNWLTHTHRYGQSGGSIFRVNGSASNCSGVCPQTGAAPEADESTGLRRIEFLDSGATSHEEHTGFASFVADSLASGQQVYLQFARRGTVTNHGLAEMQVDFGDGVCTGTAQGGFNDMCSPAGASYRTKAFEKDSLDVLKVKIGSLRLLNRLVDEETYVPETLDGFLPSPIACADPFDLGGGGYCYSESFPLNMGQQRTRHGALRLQVRAEGSDALLYEAAMYWHRHSEDNASGEYEEEIAADQAFYESVRNGQSYGVHLKAGDALDIQYDHGSVVEILDLLNQSGDMERMYTTLERDLGASSYGGGRASERCTAVRGTPGDGGGTPTGGDDDGGSTDGGSTGGGSTGGGDDGGSTGDDGGSTGGDDGGSTGDDDGGSAGGGSSGDDGDSTGDDSGGGNTPGGTPAEDDDPSGPECSNSSYVEGIYQDLIAEWGSVDNMPDYWQNQVARYCYLLP